MRTWGLLSCVPNWLVSHQYHHFISHSALSKQSLSHRSVLCLTDRVLSKTFYHIKARKWDARSGAIWSRNSQPHFHVVPERAESAVVVTLTLQQSNSSVISIEPFVLNMILSLTYNTCTDASRRWVNECTLQTSEWNVYLQISAAAASLQTSSGKAEVDQLRLAMQNPESPRICCRLANRINRDACC